MSEYISMWKNYVNFSDRTTVRGYWMAVLFNFFAGVIIGIIAASAELTALSGLYSLAVFLPSLAIVIRRLRDAGRPWYHIFFGLIPIAGAIILIVFMCQKSAPDDGTPVV